MAAETVAPEFDPLVEFYGMWTTELAEHYLPIPFARMVGKYECQDGYLIMSPREGSRNSYAALELGHILRGPARAAGHLAYLALNVEFHSNSWIEPDLVVLKQPVDGLTWIPAEKVLIPIEFVSASSRRRDRIDKPGMCAEAGIPYFMRVEVDKRNVQVTLCELDRGGYVVHAEAVAGQLFETELPFPISFDPGVLLEP
ncbi:Uma2 family endonuclease [Kibdelosporangium banguiense]|uniref:Uma2 family endonuclease n=1 Tax=Kibdelosporangium banguiense TaxID=1365924 RepID=A0ABS4TBV0_9PSEU|nr:Uma2 family endonuclease [Kibdelosporangium banguiense]MBP2321901.1 Uma2 family endonuclease [Kibdelosporangium banguiense]